MADYRAKIQRKNKPLLEPGERVLATVRAAIEGPPLAMLGGAALVLALSADARIDAEAKGFPAAINMLLAVTDRRLLVFRRLFLRRSHGFRGQLAFEALGSANLERRGMSPRLHFVLASGAELTFTTYRLDHPDEFIRILNSTRQTATAVRVPSPPTIPVVPPSPPL
jgi:hypothetical protein